MNHGQSNDTNGSLLARMIRLREEAEMVTSLSAQVQVKSQVSFGGNEFSGVDVLLHASRSA